MAPPRASWKGYLKIAELMCPVALYAAASASERIALHTVNRATGHRVHRQYVDAATGDAVEKEDQVKGYEVAKDEYVVLEPDEVAAAVPHNDKTLNVLSFVDEHEVDDVYFDRPYYLAPADRIAEEAFSLVREGLRAASAVAIGRAVLFRRVRSVLLRPLGPGLAATTLHFDYEVRSAAEVFAGVPETPVKGEMLELAEHIIQKKQGQFDPRSFHDRYEAALAELVKAKLEGRAIEAPKRPKPQAPSDLLAALRDSAGLIAPRPKRKSVARGEGARTRAGGRKKAG